MGLSASKLVPKTLQNSPEFDSACDSTYSHCISLTQRAFPGVKPYQLLSATEHLHTTLSLSVPLISRWVPHPPSRNQVDRALKAVVVLRSDSLLDETEFKAFAVQVFANAVIEGARREALARLPIGVLGIVGIGVVVRPPKGLVAAAIGAYALGFATSVYLGL